MKINWEPCLENLPDLDFILLFTCFCGNTSAKVKLKRKMHVVDWVTIFVVLRFKTHIIEINLIRINSHSNSLSQLIIYVDCESNLHTILLMNVGEHCIKPCHTVLNNH